MNIIREVEDRSAVGIEGFQLHRVVMNFVDDEGRGCQWQRGKLAARASPGDARSVLHLAAVEIHGGRCKISQGGGKFSALHRQGGHAGPVAGDRSTIGGAVINSRDRRIIARVRHLATRAGRVSGDIGGRQIDYRRQSGCIGGEGGGACRPRAAGGVHRQGPEIVGRASNQSRHLERRRAALHSEVYGTGPVGDVGAPIDGAVVDGDIGIRACRGSDLRSQCGTADQNIGGRQIGHRRVAIDGGE